MRKNQPVNNRESTFDEGTPLVSTTDLKGQITFVNEAFVEVSGFSRDELIGQPHNLVRHPDVPAAVFDDMWQKLKANSPWIGIVKNRCKEGGFYWVNAYVTPIVDADEVIGYQSVRSKPTATQVKRAVTTYNRLNTNRRRFSFWDISLSARVAFVSVCAPLLMLLAGGLSNWDPVLLMIVGAVSFLVCGGLSFASLQPLRRLAKRSLREINSPVLEEMYIGSKTRSVKSY